MPDSARQILARIPAFSGLSAGDRERVLASLATRTWEAGRRVIREGDASTALFVVLEGRVRVTTQTDGRDVELAELGPGTVFGEEGLLTGAPRSATVTALSALRLAVVPEQTFDDVMAPRRSVRRRLDQLSARRLSERLTHSVSALRGLQLEGTRRGEVSPVSFTAGELLMEQGASSDAVFFITQGVAVALKGGGESPTRLAKVGPGQCVGELGVLRREQRSASVVAETELQALRVEADRFRAWVRDTPQLAEYLGTLERVYPLANGRRLSVYRGLHEGREAITTLAGDPTGDCVLSTKILGEDVVVLTRGESDLDGEHTELRFEESEEGRGRELLLDRVERDARDRVIAGRVAGVEARIVGPDVSRLYHAVRDREAVDRKDLQRFLRTGYLGGDTTSSDPDRLCNCLGIGRDEVNAATTEVGRDAEAVSDALGVGLVCGACLPTLAEVLSGAEPASVDAPPPRQSTARGVESPLVVRRPQISFDPRALMRISAEPEAHVVAVASVFAAAGERFMVRRVGQALPTILDPGLVADIERFLEQESQHIKAHEPLNELLLGWVYPDSTALRRAGAGMLGHVDRLPQKIALSACAAFEHIADCAFVSLFDAYYAQGHRYSADPDVDDLVRRSGMGTLMVWHGAEELSHRHVAFDVMRASGAGMLSRWIGFSVLAAQGLLLLLPALWSLRRTSRGRPRVAGPSHRPGGARVVWTTIARSLDFLRPGFRPGDARYPFWSALMDDLRQFPDA